jgi:FAD/FMN-containing dehydrogenase
MDPGVFRRRGTHHTGAHVNFLDRDDQDRVRTAYGEDTYLRLGTIKDMYDPDNVFRHNQNITPSHAELSSAQVDVRA